MSNHQHLLLKLLTATVANVTFAMILIIWQMLAHKKGKHKQNAKTKLQSNKSFLTLFKSSFPSLDQQACASRMLIDAWDEDHICSPCIQPSFFAHECNSHDSNVIAHVRQTIASTSLLDYIQEAHRPHNNSL